MADKTTDKAATKYPSAKDIEAWKTLHGEVHELTVKADDEGKDLYKCWLKKPDRKIIAAATSLGANNPIKVGEMILNNCWLGGDEVIKTNDDLFLAAVSQTGGLIKIREAELKKC